MHATVFLLASAACLPSSTPAMRSARPRVSHWKVSTQTVPAPRRGAGFRCPRQDCANREPRCWSVCRQEDTVCSVRDAGWFAPALVPKYHPEATSSPESNRPAIVDRALGCGPLLTCGDDRRLEGGLPGIHPGRPGVLRIMITVHAVHLVPADMARFSKKIRVLVFSQSLYPESFSQESISGTKVD